MSSKETFLLCSLMALASQCGAEDFRALCADRTSVERVYYSHRLGDKPTFEQDVPSALIERLVAEDLHKEAVLKKVYGMEMTPALVQAEVQRIDTTTRAPETLVEIKAALDGDPDRFAQTVAKPTLVERMLRDKFENDDALHATQRRESEKVRERLLAAKKTGVPLTTLVALLKQGHSNEASEANWQLGTPPPETNAPSAGETEMKQRFGPNAKIISSSAGANREQKFYFEDLPCPLQRVLRLQLRQAADISAVIETSSGFLLYLAKAKSPDALAVEVLCIRKRSYEDWLKQQTEANL
jgi:hypothetical protein